MFEGKETHLFYMFIALMGGIAKQLHHYLNGSSLSWKRFFANCFVSGFSGYMVAQIFSVLKPEFSFIAGGIGGYMGVQAVDFIIIISKRLINKKV